MRHVLAGLAAIILLTGAAPTPPITGAGPGAGGPPQLALPIACTPGRTCEVQNYVDRDPASPGVLDYRCAQRTYDKHTGVDIRLPSMVEQRAGVAVLAAADGVVLRTRDGVPDISIRDPRAPPLAGRDCGNAVVIAHGGGWQTSYCHMARGSVRVKPGDKVRTGQPLGQVGLSGDTEFPHLHFQVNHGATVVDPFAPGTVARGACTAQRGLWTPAAARALAYRRGAVIAGGFAAAAPTDADIDAGRVPRAGAQAGALVVYVRAINLEAGDRIETVITGPDGKVVVDVKAPPLDRNKAVWLTSAGRKRPPLGWPKGLYRGDWRVFRAGKVALSQHFEVRL